MKIVMLASEAVPYVKTGGLGDVMGALPAALAREGLQVSLFLPLYRGLRERFAADPRVAPFCVRMHDGVEQAAVLRALDEPPGVRVFAIAGDRYFDRPYLYGEPTGDYADNARRFAYFCRAALAAIDALALAPDVIHCHDWQTSLVPVFLRAGIADGDPAADAARRLGSAAVVLTLHNLGYQGVFPAADFAATGLPRRLFDVEGIEFHGRVNLLKGGIRFADHVTTVSPGYAREIRAAEQGAGLEGVLLERAGELTGILNGIDYDVWNPATDPHLVASYSVDDLHGKRRCKADLIVECELEGGLEAPIVAMVSRLAAQKGFDILLPSLPRMLEGGLRVVALGSGEPRITAALRDVVTRFPGRIAFRETFDEALAHKIQAGADMLLMPSRYEPCGLNQMMALRYGTVPIVRATGGLVDTVLDMAAAPQQATGFWFEEYSSEALEDAVTRAVVTYRQSQEAWRALMLRGMRKDFSWTHSAARYAHLYRRVVQRTREEASAAPRIKFGTAGWRAELAEGFTVPALRAVSQAIAEHVLESSTRALSQQGILVAHDTRFLGAEFAAQAAGVLAANDVPVLWSREPLPMPAVSYAITRRDYAGGLDVTASNNPYTWNGVKFSPAWGGPALPEITADIEARANAWLARGRVIDALPERDARQIGLWRDEDAGELYRAGVAQQIDVAAVRASGLRVAVDLLWGTGRGYLDRLLSEWGVLGTVLHAEADPYFGGGRPEPNEGTLAALARAVASGHALGVATDCDADSFGVIDVGGAFVPPNHVIALLLDYLCETRPHLPRKVGRSVATSHLVDAVAAARGVEVIETPVGFKFLGELLARSEIMLGGEESGGLSILGHIPDKDGILACLLVVEMVARRRTSLREMLARLVREVGARVSLRRDLSLTEEAMERLAQRLADPPDSVGDLDVRRVVTLDGVKLVLDGDRWVLLRPSGTEPLVRLYAEAPSEGEALLLLDEAQAYFVGR
ncbi:MAG: glycogen synthase GlgA [Thermodesulfobacteriota bacterium]